MLTPLTGGTQTSRTIVAGRTHNAGLDSVFSHYLAANRPWASSRSYAHKVSPRAPLSRENLTDDRCQRSGSINGVSF